MSPIQHLRPVNLHERLCQWFHRAPQTPIPHWDAVVPPDLILPDAAALRADIEARVDRLAGVIDDAHGDLVDRIVEEILQQEHAALAVQHEQRLDLLSRIEEQGITHATRIGRQVRDLRIEQDRHMGLFEQAWYELSGDTPPASAPADGALADPLTGGRGRTQPSDEGLPPVTPLRLAMPARNARSTDETHDETDDQPAATGSDGLHRPPAHP